MAIRAQEAFDSIYAHQPPRCPECNADLSVLVDGHSVHADDCKREAAAAIRRADLRERLLAASERGRQERANRADQRKEKEVAATKAAAEALNNAELKAALKEAGVTGYSKLGRDDLIAEYVKAFKPKASPRRNGSGEPRELAEGQVRVPSPIAWSASDSDYTGKSPSANWNGSRWQIGKYLKESGQDPDEIKAALAVAKEKLDGGAKSVKVLTVTIRVTD